MKKIVKKWLAAGCTAAMILFAAGCSSRKTEKAAAADNGPKTLRITWWGSQSRHEYTQNLLDAYTQKHPDIKFEATPSGWDGYFDKLSTETAAGAMPDIVQMDYLYITTYAKNNSVVDLQQFIDDGTIDVSHIDKNILNTGLINNKLAGLVLSTSVLAVSYNPSVLENAGLKAPSADWTWDDFASMNKTVKAKINKYGTSVGPVDDINLFNYWVRQHGEKLFSADNKSLGYTDDSVCSSFFKMWKNMMANGSVPTPDAYEQIVSLGLEGSPVVTGDAAMTIRWNNFSTLVSKANDTIKLALPPKGAGSDGKGLWMKPGMFFCVAQTSTVKKEAAEFINWFINSKEANDIIMGERGTPVSSEIRDYLSGSGKMTPQQKDMFQYVNEAGEVAGMTPPPDPVGMSEINKTFKNVAYSVFYDQTTPDKAAADFRKQADEILARNN